MWLLGAKKQQRTWDDSAPSMATAGPGPAPNGPSVGLAQAQSIPLSTDGLSDPNVPASVPKWNQILPQNTIAQLGTKNQRLDFNIQCQDIGKIQNMLVQFDYTTGATAPSLIPTPYWVNRVDFIAPDGNTLETVYADSLFTETCSLLTDQTVSIVAPLYNFQVVQTSTGTASLDVSGALATGPISVTSSTGTDDNSVVSFAPPVTPATSYTHWLSLNSSFLVACQPYLRGCSSSGYVKLQLYLNDCIASDGSPTTQGTITLNQANLWLQEAVLSQTAEKALMAAHKSGIQYSSVVRNQSVYTMTALNANNQDKFNLQGFFSESAGLYVMFKPSSSNPDCLTRIPVASMYLQDSQGRQLTQEMSSQLIEAIVSPQVIAVSSYFVNSPNQTTYIFPFCTNLQRVIEGKMLGSYQLTGNERLVVTAASNISGGSQLVVSSWDYAKLVVVNNQMKQYVLGSNA